MPNSTSHLTIQDQLRRHVEAHTHQSKTRRERRKNKHNPEDSSSSSSSSSSNDDADDPRRHRETRSASHRTVTTDATSTLKSDSRYTDAPLFKGDPDNNLERWIAMCNTKFRKSYSMFETEWDKIEYIRDHTSKAAWDLVEYKALNAPESERYQTTAEIYKDLREAFGVPDRQSATLADLTTGKLNQKDDETLGGWFCWISGCCEVTDTGKFGGAEG
jgi:hypothetical protein